MLHVCVSLKSAVRGTAQLLPRFPAKRCLSVSLLLSQNRKNYIIKTALPVANAADDWLRIIVVVIIRQSGTLLAIV